MPSSNSCRGEASLVLTTYEEVWCTFEIGAVERAYTAITQNTACPSMTSRQKESATTFLLRPEASFQSRKRIKWSVRWRQRVHWHGAFAMKRSNGNQIQLRNVKSFMLKLSPILTFCSILARIFLFLQYMGARPCFSERTGWLSRARENRHAFHVNRKIQPLGIPGLRVLCLNHSLSMVGFSYVITNIFLAFFYVIVRWVAWLFELLIFFNILHTFAVRSLHVLLLKEACESIHQHR